MHAYTQFIYVFDRIIFRYGKMTESQARFYFNQLMEALSYCHAMNICHRDLKPEV